ncbi:hypothetical protein VTJ49DRAFT_744 [Mycothermus thermophilus]|uniref:Telomere length regulation protein conserved domain-containing protein n=1 Tax=Humicola insolens TaxID=85995 RepID=A0ABR3VEC1_HUMIN
MEELLRPASIVGTKEDEANGDFLRESKEHHHQAGASHSSHGRAPTTPEEALEILKSEPDYDTLTSTLNFLLRHHTPDSAPYPTIRLPSPLSAQLVQVLVSDIVPNYWALLVEDSQQSKYSSTTRLGSLIDCLASVAGVNAILVRLRALIQEAKSEAATKIKRPDIVLNLRIICELLSRLLRSRNGLLELYLAALATSDQPSRMKPLLHEIVAMFGSGRIISLAAEADELIKANGGGRELGDFWPADPVQYTEWLGRNIVKMVSSEKTPEASRFEADLLAKALRLGHFDRLIKQLMLELVLDPARDPKDFGRVLGNLPSSDQRKVLHSVLKMLSAEYLDRLGRCESEESKPLISAAAGVLNSILSAAESARRHLVDWLTSSSGAGLGDGIGIRRAVMAVTSQNRDDLMSVFERSLSQFGDHLYIRHSPALQQEAHAQVLLLTAGYVYRTSPVKLAMALRSGPWMNAISNRLAASNQRARFLGILVGEALSGLVDKEDKRLNFKMEETGQPEGRWYKGLVEVSDSVGPLDALHRIHVRQLHTETTTESKNKHKLPKPAPKPMTPHEPKSGFIIEELSDGEPPEEDDIVPYAKPDSDPEDSDDDPTLVRRDRPKAPVYIRDLIRYLRDTENYDHQTLALTTAPTLIRRKADYGTEVSEHADEVASLLVGLSDKFNMDNFDELRLQGMIALVVAKPEQMGPWFAKTFFEGDYSISQRASVLAVLGMSARELAGLETSDYAASAAFPSKTLPEQVARLYLDNSTSPSKQPASSLKGLPRNALENIASSLTDAWLAPTAAKAADAATGPDVLKLSTFSSRLNQDNSDHQPLLDPSKTKYTTKPRPRQRAILNTTANLIATSFFAPLIARFQAALHTSSSSRSRTATAISHPHLLSLYLQTLALLLHASGPSTLALPSMTAELWRLLLSTRVRAAAVGDLAVTRAVLFGFLAMLDLNEDRARDVCAELGREVVEAMEWVGAVFVNSQTQGPHVERTFFFSITMATPAAQIPSLSQAAAAAAPAQATNAASKPKPCCVCKEEKSQRDECLLFSNAADPEKDCQSTIERYRSCMAGFGFKV